MCTIINETTTESSPIQKTETDTATYVMLVFGLLGLVAGTVILLRHLRH